MKNNHSKAINSLRKLAEQDYKCGRLAGTMRRIAAKLPAGIPAILMWHEDHGFFVQTERAGLPYHEICRLFSVDDCIDVAAIQAAACELASALESPQEEDVALPNRDQ